jgi:acetyl-CoA/propionyl-CoA carboxylase biotin carboxyl carrier protein
VSASARPFQRVLVANRGEIAIRVFRACRELGLGTVAVYSDADREALHVRYADEAHRLGPGAPAESYLHTERVLEAARRSGADAIHPGYGFLAENAPFARACAEAGIVWIGPPPEAMDAMGSKIGARRIMAAAGVPIVPGTTERVTDPARVIELGEQYGWPIALKASAGGGGKGLKVVHGPDEAERALESAQREGLAYFADSAVYVEKYVEDPRHVEIQVMADTHGSVVALGERDCTLQRRHQKIVEETPSPAVDADLRARMGAMAIDAARAVGYVNAGTIECLLDRSGDFYFLEMNTRIQVEHTITEAVTGIDLVREQLRVAAGEPLSFRQEDVEVRGHAIECRINAEDPAAGFLPSPGRIVRYREPAGPGVRVDAAMEEGGEIVALYDPMVAKLVVWDRDRDSARARMRRALDEYVVEGVRTLIPLHRLIMEAPEFARGETCAGLVEDVWPRQLPAEPPLAAAADGHAGHERHFTAEVDGRRLDVRVHVPEGAAALEVRNRLAERRRGSGHAAGAGTVASPMQGTVLKVAVVDGDAVETGQVLAVVEAMKMENEILAPRDGIAAGVAVIAGQAVQAGQTICEIEEAAG